MRKQKYEPGIGTEIEIAMMNGVVHRGRGSIARGHPSIPPSRAEIEDKLRECADGIAAATNHKSTKKPLELGTRPVDLGLASCSSPIAGVDFCFGRGRYRSESFWEEFLCVSSILV